MSVATVQRVVTRRIVQLGDVVQNLTVTEKDPVAAGLQRYVGLEHLDPGVPRVGRWGLLDDDSVTFTRRFHPQNVLFGKRRAYQRKAGRVDFPGVCSGDLLVLQAGPEMAPELLPFVVQTEAFTRHAVSTSAGGLSPRTRWRDLAQFEFPLPGLERQRRIAEMLWAATEIVFAYEAAIRVAEVARAACLESIVSDELASAPRVALRDVCSMQNGRPFPSGDYCDGGIRLLRPGNLAATGYFDWSEGITKFLPARYSEEANDFAVLPGDVVVNLTAQTLEDGFMGRVCLAREGDDCLLNQRIGRFRCADGLLPEYLFRVLQSRAFRRVAESRCGGSKIRHLYWHHIEDFELPLPAPRSQRAMVDRLRAVDAATADLQSHVHTATRSAEALREMLLDRS